MVATTMIASTGVTAAVVVAAAGAVIGAGIVRSPQAPIPVRVKVRRRLGGIRRR